MYYELNCHIGDFSDDDRQIVRKLQNHPLGGRSDVSFGPPGGRMLPRPRPTRGDHTNIIFFLPNISHTMCFYSVNTSYKTFISNYEKKYLSNSQSQSKARGVLFPPLILQSCCGFAW